MVFPAYYQHDIHTVPGTELQLSGGSEGWPGSECDPKWQRQWQSSLSTPAQAPAGPQQVSELQLLTEIII